MRRAVTTVACFFIMLGPFTTNIEQVFATKETMSTGYTERESHQENVLSGSERTFMGMTVGNPEEKTHKRSKRLVPVVAVLGIAILFLVHGCEGEIEHKSSDGSSTRDQNQSLVVSSGQKRNQ
ncbi:hypothetical protein [Pasteuria penetrans]|uniref:hypothetical protein n=1 Tax=Pasteuria penetrans TaxID=86005 RepID=UPI0011EC4AAD|nr:hypothetical protein [Pasteuria penetrans]